MNQNIPDIAKCLRLLCSSKSTGITFWSLLLHFVGDSSFATSMVFLGSLPYNTAKREISIATSTAELEGLRYICMFVIKYIALLDGFSVNDRSLIHRVSIFRVGD